MQKTITLLTAILLFSITAIAQLEKRTWLLGGSGSYTSSNQSGNFNTNSIIQTTLYISPNIGYFIIDKFAIGIEPSLTLAKIKTSSITNTQNSYFTGIFAKYYLLKKDKIINIFLKADYAYGNNFINNSSSKSNSSYNAYQIEVGPVHYFNNSVGIEFFIGYKRLYYDGISNSFQTGIGFQFYLQK